MARILLLDDSPTMHRVVRLTFADDQRMDIAVARHRAEADQSITSQATDLIIAYVRFDGLTDPRYFESLRLVTPRILLLAESEENLDAFSKAGFTHVLRKPFHSDELRQVVENMLNQHSHPVDGAGAGLSFRDSADTQQTQGQDQSQSGFRPQLSLDLSFLETSIEPDARDSIVSAPPLTFTPEFFEDEDTKQRTNGRGSVQTASFPDEATKLFVQPQPPAAPPPAPPAFLDPPAPAASMRPAAPSASKLPPPPPPPPFPISNQSATPASSASSAPQVPPMAPVRPSAAKSAAPVTSSPNMNPFSKGIEPSATPNHPFEIEDVVIVSKHKQPAQQTRESFSSLGFDAPPHPTGARAHDGAGGLSRQDVERLVEDSMASAVNRAVRQALTETLPDLRQAIVVEVSQRAVEQVANEMASAKRAIREQMLADIRELSAQWLRKETPNLAKDVIREEIRRAIEQL